MNERVIVCSGKVEHVLLLKLLKGRIVRPLTGFDIYTMSSGSSMATLLLCSVFLASISFRLVDRHFHATNATTLRTSTAATDSEPINVAALNL